MSIRLFEIENRTVRPTEHCYMISWLNDLIEEFPEEHLKVLAYIYYITDISPENPYFNTEEEDREEKVLRDLQPEFDVEHPKILVAIDNCKELYQTPTQRSYISFKTMLENLNVYLETAEITDGRDGNINALLRAAKEFDKVRESFKGVQADVKEETKVRARGGAKIPYDLKRRG